MVVVPRLIFPNPDDKGMGAFIKRIRIIVIQGLFHTLSPASEGSKLFVCEESIKAVYPQVFPGCIFLYSGRPLILSISFANRLAKLII